MEIKLVSIDLDGTFVRTDGSISDRNLTAVKKAVAAGLHIVIASGRIRCDAACFRSLTGSTAPVIASNGAVVLDGSLDRPIMARGLDREKTRDALGRVHSLGLACHVYHGGSVVMERSSPVEWWYRNRMSELPPAFRFSLVMVDDLEDWLRESDGVPEKLMVVERDEARMAVVRESLSSIPDVSTTGSHRTNREVLAAGVSKGAALGVVTGYLGVPREAVVAIGDNENDLSMLAFARYPVAMGNASAAVRSAALHVTASNDEDGVALVLESILSTGSLPEEHAARTFAPESGTDPFA